MAEETQVPASEAPAAADATQEKPAVKDEVLPPAAEEEPKKPESAEEPAEAAAAEVDGGKKDEEAGASESVEDPQKKALDELKELVRTALANHEFSKPPPPPVAAPGEEKPAEKTEEPAAEVPKEDKPAAGAPKEEKPTDKAEKAAAEAPKEEEKPADKAAEAAAEAPKEEGKPGDKAEEAAAEVPKEDKPAEKAEEPAAEESAKVEEGAHDAPAKEEEAAAMPPPPPEEVFLWGVPLLGDDEKSDTVLLKFLRARDFKPKDALAMLKATVAWRREFGMEGLLEEDLGAPAELAKVVFMQGHGREGHPVCYNVYGEFQDRELYQRVLADEEKRGKFLRWRIQFLERGIREQLDFGPSGVSSMVQVTDLKNAPGPWKWELRQATKALALLQDNYPEFVATQVFINVPWWYLAFNRMISTFLTQRTKSKFVFAGPSKSSETLFKYVAPEQVPLQFGGLSKEKDADFSTSDAVAEVSIKPSTKHAVEIPVAESCVLVWELRVLGWDVSYGAEFVPAAEDGYTVIVHKARRFAPTDEPFVKNSFKVGEPGKILLTVDNSASKKKKVLLYRSKAKGTAESM
ncbi:hypothetical protein Taro_020855 [Colocasia esculenta]|uniref:Patellin-3 n=1 Tax=Colocasia esculenta TaxID=4460 RepID=A0A843UXG0_COLES|nr:hypothetical protein [Colocasia esculenta]